MIILESFQRLPRFFRDLRRVSGIFLAIFRDIWTLLMIFRTLIGKFSKFWEFERFLEIRREFWIVLGHFQGVSESFVES